MDSSVDSDVEKEKGLSPLQQVKNQVKEYISDPESDPLATRLLSHQQTIIDSQEALFASMQANMIGVLQREVDPLRIRVEQLEATQRINLGIALVCGVLIGGALVHYAGKLSK